MNHLQYIDLFLEGKGEKLFRKFAHSKYINVNQDWIPKSRLAKESRQQLQEKFIKVEGIPVPIELIKNPSKYEIEGDVDIEDEELRGMLLNNDMYIWKIASETAEEYGLEGDLGVIEHSVIIKAMDWREKPFIPIIIYPKTKRIEYDGYSFAMSSLYYLEKKQIYERVISHPKIKALGYKFISGQYE